MKWIFSRSKANLLHKKSQILMHIISFYCIWIQKFKCNLLNITRWIIFHWSDMGANLLCLHISRSFWNVTLERIIEACHPSTPGINYGKQQSPAIHWHLIILSVAFVHHQGNWTKIQPVFRIRTTLHQDSSPPCRYWSWLVIYQFILVW